MCLTVTQTASQHDLVVTGSKDHYVKVPEAAAAGRPEAGGGGQGRFLVFLPPSPSLASVAVRLLTKTNETYGDLC